MNVSFYRLTRDLHLYFGLFISPFILLFSISVFFLVHSWIPGLESPRSEKREATGVALPEGLEKLSGRPLIDALKPTLRALDVPGEIGFVRHLVPEQTLVIPVSIPGRRTTVTLHLAGRTATVATEETGWADAVVTLHRSPGQHGPGIRMNWVFMKVWRWAADATVYLTLFMTFSGLYLWYVLRSERKTGFILLLAGTVCFFGIAYAVSR